MLLLVSSDDGDAEVSGEAAAAASSDESSWCPSDVFKVSSFSLWPASLFDASSASDGSRQWCKIISVSTNSVWYLSKAYENRNGQMNREQDVNVFKSNKNH